MVEDPLVELLDGFASSGRRQWRARLPDVSPWIELPMVQRHLVKLGLPGTQDDQLQAFEAAVEEAISLLPEPARRATEILFGFRDSEKPPLGKTERQDLAARELSRSGRWMRSRINSSPYDGATPYEHLVKTVADLLTQEVPETDARVEGAFSQAADDSRARRRRGRATSLPKDSIGSHEQLRRLYVEPMPGDIDQGFWWRPSTDRYVAQLAALSRLVIYAGADGPADVGPPIHAEVAAMLLRNALVAHPLLAKHAQGDERGIPAVADGLVHAMEAASAGSSHWMGSIVTGLYRIRPGFTNDVTTAHLEAALGEVTKRIATSGFVSRPITNLALTLSRNGTPVAVISEHYDSDLEAVAADVREALGPRRSSEDAVYATADRYTPPEAEGRVPLIRLQKPGRPLIGEADYVNGGPGELASLDSPDARTGLLTQALEESPMLFVGTSLTDAGLVAALAATLGSPHARYALLLPPPEMRNPYPEEPRTEEGRRQAIVDRTLQLALIAARYLHLGVIPIFADFPYQVPQFLREMALRVASTNEGEPYHTLAERFDAWWDGWATLFGFKAVSADPRLVEVKQEHAYRTLQQLRANLSELLIVRGEEGVEDDEAERLIIEVWLRNPKARYLFRWATSEGMWMSGPAAPRASLRESGTLTQQAFREGDSIWRADPAADEWRFCLAMNLTLEQAPWHHLPIGVIKVFSNRSDGALWAVANSDERKRLEGVVKQRVRQLLDDD